MRKVDNGGSVLVVQKDIELIEVTVNETEGSKLHYQLHQNTVEGGRVRHTVNLAAAMRCGRREEGERGGERERESL